MRILRVISSINPEHGGPTAGLISSSEALTKLGHSTEVVTVDDRDSPFLKNLPFRVHACGGSQSFYEYSSRLLGWLRANTSRFDIVIQDGLWNYTSLATWK